MVSDARKIYDKKREKKSYMVTVLAKNANKESVNTRRHTSPCRLSDFKQFGSRRRHLRAYKMVSDARKIHDKKKHK